MENKSSKILLGCGVVFGIFVVLIVLLGFGIYSYVKNATDKKDEIVKLNDFIEQKYGTVAEFVPPNKGVIDSVKFTHFVSIRDSLMKYDDDLASTLGIISSKVDAEDEDVSFWETIGVMKTALDLIPNLLTYVKKRNEFLIQYNLSLGDYIYYYTIGYYSFLKKPINDGPPFNLLVSGDKDKSIVTFKDENEIKGKDPQKYKQKVLRQRKIDLSGEINLLFIKIFENAMENIDSLSESYRIYSDELTKLKKNDLRIPWQDGLPAKAELFMKKFTKRLDNTYNPIMNSLETGLIIK